MKDNKQGAILWGVIGAEESYLPIHESGHLGVAKTIDYIPGIDSITNPYKSNFGDTKVVELIEKAGFLPDNDYLRDWNNDGIADLSYQQYLYQIFDTPNKLPGPLGYAYASSDNPIAQKAILAGGHVGVLGTAAISGYLGKKFNNLPMKIYSSIMSLAPTLQGIKDYFVGNSASDLARLSEMTGMKEISLISLLGLGTASILSYNWGTEIKNIFGSIDRKLGNIYKVFTKQPKPTEVAI